MILNKRDYVNAYSPYWKEALYCLTIDIGVIVIGILIAIGSNAPVLIICALVVFILEILFNYNYALLSFLEIMLKSFITTQVNVVSIKIEDSTSSRWGSIIPELYPKSQKVNRYKFKCVDSNGKKVTIRCVMSSKKLKIILNEFGSNEFQCSVIIGKFSHIILKYCDKNDWAVMMNRNL